MEALALLRRKLSTRQKSLGGCLAALHSVSWEKLGNGLCAGRVSLKDFHTFLRQGPSSLHHIQVNKVIVVDHLGRNIPVPTMFCSSWKEFDFIIHGYCKDSIGSRFIERGDYEVIRAGDSRTISPSEFSSLVEPGMVIEMSIILRKRTAFEENEEKCPRCNYINLNISVNNGWIECRKCSGQFQIATASDSSGNSDQLNKLKPLNTDGNSGRPSDEHREPDIISPATSREAGAVLPGTEIISQQDDDGKQFFRRIQVIYTNSTPLEMIYDEFGTLDNAENALMSMLRIEANSHKKSENFLRLGIVHERQGQYNNSLLCFNSILDNPPSLWTDTDIWFYIGRLYEQQNEHQKAKDVYERVVANDPTNAKVLQQLDWLHLQNGLLSENQDVVIQYLTKGLEIDPKYAHGWYLLGRAYMASQKYNMAFEAYQQAIYRDSRNSTFWCSIGDMYFQVNQFHDALDAYFRAIRINPHIMEVWFNLGSLYESCDQISDALDAFAWTSELDPGNPLISERLQQLQAAQARRDHLSEYAHAVVPPLPGPSSLLQSFYNRPISRTDPRGSPSGTDYLPLARY